MELLKCTFARNQFHHDKKHNPSRRDLHPNLANVYIFSVLNTPDWLMESIFDLYLCNKLQWPAQSFETLKCLYQHLICPRFLLLRHMASLVQSEIQFDQG